MKSDQTDLIEYAVLSEYMGDDAHSGRVLRRENRSARNDRVDVTRCRIVLVHVESEIGKSITMRVFSLHAVRVTVDMYWISSVTVKADKVKNRPERDVCGVYGDEETNGEHHHRVDSLRTETDTQTLLRRGRGGRRHLKGTNQSIYSTITQTKTRSN